MFRGLDVLTIKWAVGDLPEDRSKRCRRCTCCKSDTPRPACWRYFSGSGCSARWHARWSATSQGAQPAPPGDPLDDSPLPNRTIWDITLTERDKQAELRRSSAMALPRCVVSRYATAWAKSIEGAMSHQSWALLCRYRCRLLLAEVPKGVDRNSELKPRLHLWETGQQHSGERCNRRQTSSAGIEPVPRHEGIRGWCCAGLR